MKILREILGSIRNYKWRKKNKHNFTTLKSKVEHSKIAVGNYTYGEVNVLSYGNKNEGLTIGNFCSIASDVKFMLSGGHEINSVSTFPFKAIFLGENESICKGPIVIKDDVWIGYGALIMSGVTIGQGAVIAANSVVTKDIPPYAIYINNKEFKYRFNDEIIQKLLLVDYSRIDKSFIINNLTLFYKKELSLEDVDLFLDQYNKQVIGDKHV